jgi:hypothetical protein
MSDKLILKAYGTALWCKVQEPEFHPEYSPDGMFRTKLVITEAEKDRLEGIFNPLIAAHRTEVLNGQKTPAARKALEKALKNATPFKAELDENGDETGDYVMNFKRKAVLVAKATGKVYPQSVKVLHGKGTPLPKTTQIGNGSEIVVAFEVGKKSSMETPGYYMANTKEIGLSLQLVAVLVKTLEEWTGDDGASLFDEEEFGEEVVATTTADDESDAPDRSGTPDTGSDY